MGRSQETYGKKEVRNKKEKKRKEKEKRRLEKKEQGKSASFDDMIAYVDENGVILDSPPDPDNKEEIELEDIDVGIPRSTTRKSDIQKTRTGKVINYDGSKGYGFIRDDNSNDSIFVHKNDCLDEIRNDNKVEFETEKGPKGLKAIQVKVVS